MLRRVAVLLLIATPAARAGDVVGVVRLSATRPAPPPLEVTKDRPVCGGQLPDESLAVRDGRVANVIVHAPGPPATPRSGALDQKGCRFVPRVQVLPVGSTLEIRNDDPILHTARGQQGKMKVFDVPTPTQGERVPKTLARPGLVRVDCDVHSWMRAFVWVADGPAAVTGADGSFRLTLPAGPAMVTAWHETLGERTARVEVPATGEANVEIVF